MDTKKSKINTHKELAKQDLIKAIIVMVILIVMCIAPSCYADFWIYDTEESIWRDYGTITNYYQSLEERLAWEKTNRHLLIKEVTNTVHQVVNEECQPTFWQKYGQPICAVLGIIIGILVF